MQSLSKEIQECRAHAEQCARKARLAPSVEVRQDFLRLQKSWLDLAQSYECAERLVNFSGGIEARHRRRIQ